MTYLPLVVSALALAFTVTSFWWLQARRGRMVGYPPPSFGAGLEPTGDAVVFRLPVVLYNSGARTRVVTRLRLVVLIDDAEVILRWRNFRTSIRTDENDLADLPHAFTVPGRAAVSKFVEFDGVFPGGLPEPVHRRARLDALLDGGDAWQTVVSFDLWLLHWWNAKERGTYRNVSEPCSDDEAAKARNNMLEVARLRKLPTPTWAD